MPTPNKQPLPTPPTFQHSNSGLQTLINTILEMSKTKGSDIGIVNGQILLFTSVEVNDVKLAGYVCDLFDSTFVNMGLCKAASNQLAPYFPRLVTLSDKIAGAWASTL